MLTKKGIVLFTAMLCASNPCFAYDDTNKDIHMSLSFTTKTHDITSSNTVEPSFEKIDSSYLLENTSLGLDLRTTSDKFIGFKGEVNKKENPFLNMNDSYFYGYVGFKTKLFDNLTVSHIVGYGKSGLLNCSDEFDFIPETEFYVFGHGSDFYLNENLVLGLDLKAKYLQSSYEKKKDTGNLKGQGATKKIAPIGFDLSLGITEYYEDSFFNSIGLSMVTHVDCEKDYAKIDGSIGARLSLTV